MTLHLDMFALVSFSHIRPSVTGRSHLVQFRNPRPKTSDSMSSTSDNPCAPPSSNHANSFLERRQRQTNVWGLSTFNHAGSHQRVEISGLEPRTSMNEPFLLPESIAYTSAACGTQPYPMSSTLFACSVAKFQSFPRKRVRVSKPLLHLRVSKREVQ